jgi:hypothetical protein
MRHLQITGQSSSGAKSQLLNIALTVMLATLAVQAQSTYPRMRRGTASPATLGAYKGVVVTFHGKLKVLDKKKIVIETDEKEEKELVSIRLTGKTKFFDKGKPVKPASIDMETEVTVDASEDTDLSVVAINVTVGSPEKANPKPN